MSKSFRIKIEYVKYYIKRKDLCSYSENLGFVRCSYYRIIVFVGWYCEVINFFNGVVLLEII